MNSSPDSHLMQSSTATQQDSLSVPPVAPQGGSLAPLNPPAGSTPGPAPIDEAALEQQLIEKARGIIARTQDDPYMQSKLLSELKLEYLEIRYGRASASKEKK